MIISRTIAGIGGGGIISLMLVIISDVVSLQDRGKYQGMIVGVFGFASVVGPLIGGVFTGK
jgi:MFS family permease